MKKELRFKLYNKFNGHCAYCGKKITYNQMQEDHIVPLYRNDTDQQLIKRGLVRGSGNITNKNPACGRCNRYKSDKSLEEFRRQLSLQVERARKTSWNFRCAEDYGLIQILNKPIKFYFEK